MNKARRKSLDNLRNLIEEHMNGLAELVADLDGLKDEEQESFDNMSEGLQASENGQRIEAAADALANAHSELESVGDTLQTVLDSIDEAVGA